MAQQHRKRRQTEGGNNNNRKRKPKGRKAPAEGKKTARRDRAVAAKASPGAHESEPTPDQLEAERASIDEQNEKLRAKRQVPAAGKDLLASYMEQLSHIPLYTPEQEAENARTLERLELTTWEQLLAIPKAVQHLFTEGDELEDDVRASIDKLLSSYRRAAAHTRKQTLPTRPARDKAIASLAARLRRASRRAGSPRSAGA